MSRTKPDRFAQQVERNRYQAAEGMGYVLLEASALRLLRLQHRRIIREIKKPSGYVMVTAFRFDLLDRIKAMRFK